MAPTLGKRRREGDDHIATASSKRLNGRNSRPCINDENTPPSLNSRVQYDATNTNGLELDELDDPFNISSNSFAQRSISVTLAARKLETSSVPAKNNTHFSKISKPTTHEYKDNIQLRTPKTPRHRDALSKRVPITPRHRAITARTPQTPRTPSTPSNAPTIYNAARQLFVQSADPGRLVGREQEREKLNTFVNAGIVSKSGRSIYISGPPGTGKSALVKEACEGLKDAEDLQLTYINCMSVKSVHDIYEKLLEDTGCNRMDVGAARLATLKALFFPKTKAFGQVYVVVLDEIDHLLTLDLEILYTLFEWSLARNSRLILIGIANALDFTDRFLPRLKARNLKPELLPFLPYTVPQIGSVITTKLKSLLAPGSAPLDFVPYLHPAAIQFCSKKVASQTGDLRKAFDIVRRAIDLVEAETRQSYQEESKVQVLQKSPSKTPLMENNNLSSPCSPPQATKRMQFNISGSLAPLTHENAPRATIAHVARVTASVFSHGTAQRLQSLNLQQKAALCSLVALEKEKAQLKRNLFSTPSKGASTAPTIRKVYEMYSGLCKRENALHPLAMTEFGDVIGSLEALSLVQSGDGKGIMGLGLARLTPSKKLLRAEDRSVVSCVTEREIEGCLDGIGGGILKKLLYGE